MLKSGNIWKTLFPICLIVFLDMMSIGITIPILTPLFFDPAISVLPESYSFRDRSVLYGFLQGSFPASQFLAAPILGALSDKFGRKNLLVVSLLGTVLANFLFGLGIVTHSIPLLFVSRILDGVTAGNLSIAASATADISTDENKSKNFGITGAAYALGFILGPVIGSFLAKVSLFQTSPLSTPFWFATLFSILSLVILFIMFKETLHTRLNSKINIFSSFELLYKGFSIKSLRTMFAVIFFLGFGFNFFIYFFQVFLFEKFNFTESQTGLMFGYAGIWIVLALGLLNGIIVKKITPEKILTFSPILLAISFVVLLIPDYPSRFYFILPFAAVFYGLNQPNSLTVVSNMSSEETQGEVLGINQSVSAIAQAIPPVLAGYAVNRSIELPIILAALSTLIAWMIYMPFYVKNKRIKDSEVFHE